MPCCPACGHSWTTGQKRTPVVEGPVDTASLSDKALYAYYKRTAPAADCAFIVAKAPELAALVPEKPTHAAAKRLAEAWRRRGRRASDEAAFWAYHRARPRDQYDQKQKAPEILAERTGADTV